jgi:tripartite-type tricarboxylate transporter receptor subunit TctC
MSWNAFSKIVLGVQYAFGVVLALTFMSAGAQEYPAKPIRVLVPNAPGGSTATPEHARKVWCIPA